MTPQAQHIWLAVEPVDMRLGIEGLSARIQHTLGRAPCDGSAYAFCNQRRNRIKLLIWDGTGVWLAQRRLHRGHFTWPQCSDTLCTLDPTQWQWLTTGVDWTRLTAPPQAHWQI
jgi:transposase